MRLSTLATGAAISGNGGAPGPARGVGGGRHRRLAACARILHEVAAGREHTAIGQTRKVREPAADRPEGARQVDVGQGVEQAARVRVRGATEELPGRRHLHQLAGIEDPHPVAHLGDDGEVMADVEDGGADIVSEAGHQLEDPRLCGDVEPRGRLVHDEQAGVAREGHGDD